MSAAALIYAAPAIAAQWQGGSNGGDWFFANNWQNFAVPTSVDLVLINTPTVQSPRITGAGAFGGSVVVMNKSLLVTTGGSLTSGGALTIGQGGTFTANNGASVLAGNELRIQNGGSATFDNATLTGSSGIEIGFLSTTAGSVLTLVNGAVVTSTSGLVYVGGTFDATLAIGQGDAAGTLNATSVDLGGAGSRVLFNHTGSTTFTADIINLGQVQVQGPGTTILPATTPTPAARPSTAARCRSAMAARAARSTPVR